MYNSARDLFSITRYQDFASYILYPVFRSRNFAIINNCSLSKTCILTVLSVQFDLDRACSTIVHASVISGLNIFLNMIFKNESYFRIFVIGILIVGTYADNHDLVINEKQKVALDRVNLCI